MQPARPRASLAFGMFVLASVGVAGCQPRHVALAPPVIASPTATPSPAPSASPTGAASSTPAPSGSPTASPTPTPTASPTPTATPTPAPTPTPSPTPTITPAPTIAAGYIALTSRYVSGVNSTSSGNGAISVMSVDAASNVSLVSGYASADPICCGGVAFTGPATAPQLLIGLPLHTLTPGTIDDTQGEVDGVNPATLAVQRSISGAATGLAGKNGLGVAVLGSTIAVVNSTVGGGSLLTFDLNATGNATPLRAISGSNTFLCNMYAVTGDSAGTLAATGTGCGSTQSVVEFAPGANGNASPSAGPYGGGPDGIAYSSANGRYYNAFMTANIIYMVDSSPTIQGQISGPSTKLNQPRGLAFDSSGNLYVANLGTKSILVFAKGATGDAAPIKTIAFPPMNVNAAAFDQPWQIAVSM